eukprot:scaffold4752_cov97-Isochrysis_galbana.AAC.1
MASSRGDPESAGMSSGRCPPAARCLPQRTSAAERFLSFVLAIVRSRSSVPDSGSIIGRPSARAAPASCLASVLSHLVARRRSRGVLALLRGRVTAQRNESPPHGGLLLLSVVPSLRHSDHCGNPP